MFQSQNKGAATVDPQSVVNALAALLGPALLKQAQAGFKIEAGGTPVGPYIHGEGGFFGAHGLDRDVISTRVQPEGMAAVIPARFTNDTHPLYPYYTGVQADSGSEPSGPCDDPVTAGSSKTCYQTAQFGRKTIGTRELQLDRVGEILRRSEFTDLRFLNDPLSESFGGALFGSLLPGNLVIRAGAEVLWRMVEAGVSLQNWLATRFYTGNPTNNTNGGYAEFPGVDIIYGTNKVDALLGNDCTALDSIIFDFNYGSATDTDLAPTAVRLIVELYRQAQYNARKMGLMPARWAFSMRQGLFWALTDVWPCIYNTDRCAMVDPAGGTATVFVDGAEQRAMSDAMRNGMYLLIDGAQVPVVIDDSIDEESSGDNGNVPIGAFNSDVYLHNLSVRGGRPTLYWQLFDFREGAMEAIGQGRVGSMFWSDGGGLLWTYDTKNYCLVHEALMRPRLRVETPFLAGRLQNVTYVPILHEREPFPNQPYFQDGGVPGERDAESLYSDWNLPA